MGCKSLDNGASGIGSLTSITLSNGTSFVTIVPPATGMYILTLPPDLGTSGQVLTTNGAGLTSWTTVSGGGGGGSVTSVSASAPTGFTATVTNPTTTPNIALTYSGTPIPVLNGGTGVTTSAGPSSVVLRTTQENILANNIFTKILTITAAGTTTILTTATPQYIQVTGPTVQTIQLPDATTYPYGGTSFEIDNNTTSSGITVTNNSTTVLFSIPVGGAGQIFLRSNATSDGVWDFRPYIPAQAQWGTSGLTTSTRILTSSTFTLQNGANTLNLDGSAIVSSYTLKFPTTIGTSGQFLTSAGVGGTLTWSSPTAGVTSVGMTVPSFLSVTPATITSTGTFTITAPGSTGTGGVVLNTSPTITSAVGANPPVTLTNTTSTGFGNLMEIFAPNITAGNGTFMRYGVNTTSGNNLTVNFNYTGSANALNNAAFFVGSNIFNITNGSGGFQFNNDVTTSGASIARAFTANATSLTNTVLINPNNTAGITDIEAYQTTNSTIKHTIALNRFGGNITLGITGSTTTIGGALFAPGSSSIGTSGITNFNTRTIFVFNRINYFLGKSVSRVRISHIGNYNG